ncbi:MAG: hypothetical protein ACYC7A_09105 [Thermoanaerobaculia bacterium]
MFDDTEGETSAVGHADFAACRGTRDPRRAAGQSTCAGDEHRSCITSLPRSTIIFR